MKKPHHRIREGDIAGRVLDIGAVRPDDTMASAMSPTTLEDGVTFTMSPNIWFTSA
jgi:hypothetical protein